MSLNPIGAIIQAVNNVAGLFIFKGEKLKVPNSPAVKRYWRSKLTALFNGLMSAEIVRGENDQIIFSAEKIIFQLKKDLSGSGGSVIKVVISADYDLTVDVLQCKLPDGTDIQVVIPYQLSEPNTSAGEIVWPPYAITQDLIVAYKPSGGTGIDGVDYIDLNIDGRRKLVQWTVCDSGVAKYTLENALPQVLPFV